MKIQNGILPAITFRSEVTSQNMGSVISAAPMLRRSRTSASPDESTGQHGLIFRNASRTSNTRCECADNGTRFEFECYDVGHLYNLAHFSTRSGEAAVVGADGLRHSRRHRTARRDVLRCAQLTAC